MLHLFASVRLNFGHTEVKGGGTPASVSSSLNISAGISSAHQVELHAVKC